MEETCDRVAMIKDGKIISRIDMDKIRYNPDKLFKIAFQDNENFQHFTSLAYDFEEVKADKNQVTVKVNDQNINGLMNDLQHYQVVFFKEIKQSFEDYFNQTFKEEA